MTAMTASDMPSNFIYDAIAADVAAGNRGGRVQTRFPPEPNGYLHIGHAKAIVVDFGAAADFDGTCVLRLDDTNPETEDADFVNSIIHDIEWLGYEPAEVRFASDYFGRLYEWAETLIERGLAYVDDQDAEAISAGRGGYGQPGVDSPFRTRSTEENLDLFRRMRAGEFDEGSRVLRAKIDMNHENMWLRDPIIGEFYLTHPDIRVPETTREFAINASNSRFWEQPVRRYVDECLAGRTGPRGADFNMRWIASLVAETHRILMRGGVFLYPRDRKDPAKPGRLRLLYECNPIGFLIEQAGGRASTGVRAVLDVQPESLHQRVGFVFGSKEEVERIERYHHEPLIGGEQDELPLFHARSLFRDTEFTQ